MVIVRAESIKESNNHVCFKIVTQKLIAKAPSCIPFLQFNGQTTYEIHRAQGSDVQKFTRCFRSEPHSGRSAIKFKKVEIQLQQLCNTDENLPIKFSILVNNRPVSWVVTTVAKLRENQDLQLKNIKTNAFAGILKLTNFKVVENPNFVDYLRSGWQMSLSVAIDFTASNG